MASMGLKLTNDVEEAVGTESIDKTKFKTAVQNFRNACKRAKEKGVALDKEKYRYTQKPQNQAP
jgi:hypothetical protein